MKISARQDFTNEEIEDNQREAVSASTASLLADFKLAVVILAAISATVQLLLHFFVPGL